MTDHERVIDSFAGGGGASLGMSIFLTTEEGRKLGVRRPLKPNTLRRIALGIKRYVLDNPRPFIVRYNTETSDGDTRSHDLADPLPTAPTQNRFALVTPFLSPCRTHGGGGNNPSSAEDPLRTVTCTKRGEFAVVAPLVVPVTHAGDRRAHAPDEPVPTVTGANRGELAVVAPVLVQSGYGERTGQAPRVLDLGAPLGTVVAGGQKHAVVAVFLAKHFGGVVGHGPERPLGTVTAVDHHSVVAANLVHLNNNTGPSGCDEPARTVAAGGTHAALVYLFLTKYHGNGGQWSAVSEPLHTADTTDRFGLVTVTIGGQEYAIVDIGMRMLKPRELARAQGLPDSYALTGGVGDQVERIGNSVSPYPAAALVAANYAPRPAGVPA